MGNYHIDDSRPWLLTTRQQSFPWFQFYNIAGTWKKFQPTDTGDCSTTDRNYTIPAQQRQVFVLTHCWTPYIAPLTFSRSLRILYMPPIYAIISFFSYRFYHEYIYYSFIQIGELTKPNINITYWYLQPMRYVIHEATHFRLESIFRLRLLLLARFCECLPHNRMDPSDMP